MMWGFMLILSSCVAAQVTSQEVNMECEEFYDFAPTSPQDVPSSLADLKVKLVTVGGRDMLNISWAVNIDSSNSHLTGTHIQISGGLEYYCEYNPPLAQVNISESEKWFHFLVKASHGSYLVQAANFPLPPLGSGLSYKFDRIKIPSRPQESFSSTTTTTTTTPVSTAEIFPEPTSPALKTTDVTIAVFGGLAALMILSSCYLIYKNCGWNAAASLCFKNLPTVVPVPVLVVYPAESSAFQRAVVALAEFLQWHGGCSVTFDMWHQGKVAELGPMRWLAEQAKAADRVLIVCPGVETAVQCPPHHSSPEPSVPAAARDLYPLILNMVASHAKSADELAKFWVVQLGERQEKKPSTLAPELRTCRTFRLMRDLQKLCKSLHAARRGDKKMSDLLFRPGVPYCEKSAAKLKEAVEMLRGHQPSVSKEMQPLQSVISTV